MQEKKNSGIFDDRWLHNIADFSINHAEAKDKYLGAKIEKSAKMR